MQTMNTTSEVRAIPPEIPARNILPALPAQYVRAEQLLEVLFTSDARPSLRWLRQAQRERKIPSVTVGRLVFFDPYAVKAALDAKAKGRA
jgi:hypothetical protein